MERIELDSVNIRKRSQASISIISSTKLSEIQFFPVKIMWKEVLTHFLLFKTISYNYIDCAVISDITVNMQRGLIEKFWTDADKLCSAEFLLIFCLCFYFHSFYFLFQAKVTTRFCLKQYFSKYCWFLFDLLRDFLSFFHFYFRTWKFLFLILTATKRQLFTHDLLNYCFKKFGKISYCFRTALCNCFW